MVTYSDTMNEIDALIRCYDPDIAEGESLSMNECRGRVVVLKAIQKNLTRLKTIEIDKEFKEKYDKEGLTEKEIQARALKVAIETFKHTYPISFDNYERTLTILTKIGNQLWNTPNKSNLKVFEGVVDDGIDGGIDLTTNDRTLEMGYREYLVNFIGSKVRITIQEIGD